MDRGTEVFCNKKQVHPLTTVKLYTKETGKKADENFRNFASWVDRKIKSGEIKGNDAPIHGDMWREHNEEQRLYREEMDTFSPSQHAFWKKCKQVSLDRFLSLNGLHMIKQAEARTKLGRMLPMYDLLVENNLLEDFLAQ